MDVDVLLLFALTFVHHASSTSEVMTIWHFLIRLVLLLTGNQEL